MASFISQISEECNQCKNIIDHNAIKTLRFESDLSTTHQIIGPLFKKPVPLSITNLMRDHCLVPLRRGFEWSKWDVSKPQGAWPSTIVTWAAWVDRMEKFFGQEWKALGIYDAIRLSTVEITIDKELLMAALSFWCSATNTMVLPLGPIGPNVLDISAILMTCHSGLPIDAALFGCSSNLDLKALFDARAVEALSWDGQEPSKDEVQKLYKNFFNYSTLIVHFAGRGEANLRKGEHEAFLFYWYNKFICCTKSNKCLVENMPVAEALASGHTLALSQLSLRTCYAAWPRQPSKRSIRTRTNLPGSFNYGCRPTLLRVGQTSSTSCPPKLLAFSWLLNRYFHIEPKRSLNTSSALTTNY